MTSESILLVAFDGMDYELIEKYNCEEIMQEEWGRISYPRQITSRKTSELFASFITGELPSTHGVHGLAKIDNPIVEKFEDYVQKVPFFGRYKGLRLAIYESIDSLNAEKRRYTREDLRVDTVFEEVSNSKALFVPSYNPSASFIKERVFVGEGLDVMTEQMEKELLFRQEKLFEQIKEDHHDFLMCHFHYVDYVHHIFWELDKDKQVEEAYHRVNELAGKIREKAKDKYDYVIFMSDHGLPEGEKAHNDNAFYSCNKDLFEDDIPEITDFKSKIISLADNDAIKGIDL